LAGVVVHAPRDRVDLGVSTRAGTIPSTNLLRTLVDLGAVAGSVHDAVAAAITSGAATPAVLHRLVERHGRPGRSGVGALRRALAAWPLEDKPADSVLELRMARLIQRYGLPRVVFHPPRIAGYEVDFLVVGTRVVLECDGWDFHGRTRNQDERRAQRDLDLMAAGYLVFHFTWRQITRRPAWTAARIRTLLDTWSAAFAAGDPLPAGPISVGPATPAVSGSGQRIVSSVTGLLDQT
jgi:very-short-patch-repair endonuclease